MKSKKHQYVSEYFSDLAINTKFEDLPKEAVEHTKLVLLDYLGSLIGASVIESTPLAINLAKELGGKEECSIIGSKTKVSDENAAFANGFIGYSFDFIDDHNDSKAHPSAATIPVALSLCEKYQKDGKELLTSIAVGNETIARLGAAYLGNMVKQSFHPTAVLATFGATSVANRCLGLNEEQATHAQGLSVGCMAGGLYAWNSGNNYAKRVNAGHPARNGILAAKMAKHDFLGPLDVYEGQFGAFYAFGLNRQWDLEPVLKDIGKVWSYANSSIKPYPCCRYGGPNIDACLDILSKNEIDLNEIKSITAKTQSAQIELLMEPEEAKYNPQSVVDMQFSLPYQVAVTLVKKQASIDEFSLECLEDEMIQKLMPLVKAEVDEVLEKRYPDQYSSSIEIEMKDGKIYKSVIDDPLGDWRNPVSKEFVIEKFKHLARKSINSEDKIEKIVSTVLDIENLENCKDLMELINY